MLLICSLYLNNGEKYYGGLKDNTKYGNGVYYFLDGGKYTGEWNNDKKNGKGIIEIYVGIYY